MASNKKKTSAKTSNAARKPAAKKPSAQKSATPKKPAPKKSAPKKSASKKPAPKKPAPKKPTPKKPAPKKAAPKKPAPQKAAPKKAALRKAAPKKSDSKKSAAKSPARKAKMSGVVSTRAMLAYGQPVEKSRRLNPWLKRQQLHLLALKDTLLDSVTGVTRENLRAANDSAAVSAHGLHQADAGSDAYDRDFALTLLSQEQDALSEIDAALKRINAGTYGICEICNKPIPKVRLEARPFARLTVDCQNELEKKKRFTRVRQPVARLFETIEEEGAEESDEESTEANKD